MKGADHPAKKHLNEGENEGGHDVSGDPGPPRLSKGERGKRGFLLGFWRGLGPIHALVFTALIIIAHSRQEVLVASVPDCHVMIRARRPGHSFQLMLLGLGGMVIKQFFAWLRQYHHLDFFIRAFGEQWTNCGC